jgi:hypothetical protein
MSDHSLQLAMDVERLRKVAGAVRIIRHDEAAEIARHEAARREIADRLNRARKDCPHPVATTHRGTSYDGSYSTCDVCGEEVG